jgi:hypothetical protein
LGLLPPKISSYELQPLVPEGEKCYHASSYGSMM